MKARDADARELELERAKAAQKLADRLPLAAFQNWDQSSLWVKQTKVVLSEQVRIGGVNGGEIPLMLDYSQSAGIWIEPSGLDDKSQRDACNLAENLVMRLVFGCRPGLVRVHTCDFKTMGRAFSHLLELGAPTVAETITEADQLGILVNRVWEQVRQAYLKFGRLQAIGHFNEHNKGKTEIYDIICIYGIAARFEQTLVEKFKKLIANANSSNAGKLFILVGQVAGPALDAAAYLDADFLSNFTKVSLGNVDFKFPPSIGVLPYSIETERRDLAATFQAFAAAINSAKDSIKIDEKDIWSKNSSKGLRVPVGVDSNGRVFELVLGEEGMVHNVLIGGGVGSGKTILLHNIIVNLATLYSPEELEFLLLDYKDGTEFITYENLPHTRVLSLGSELIFGLRTFEWLGRELNRRAGLFKRKRVNSIYAYREATGEIIPRLVVVIDEFQRLLADPMLGFQAAGLLDDIVRRGRSFGINVVLSTQSLAGVDIQASTLANLSGRICMRIAKDDLDKFLSWDNLVPSAFTKPGQAVFNDAEGRPSGNALFQVEFIKQSAIEKTAEQLRQLAYDKKLKIPKRTAFYGSALENIDSIPDASSKSNEPLIGVALDIDAPHVSISFSDLPNAHLLAVSADVALLRVLFGNIVKQLARHSPTARFWVHDTSVGVEMACDWTLLTQGRQTTLKSKSDVSDAFTELTRILSERQSAAESVVHEPIFLVLLEPAKSRVLASAGEDSPMLQALSLLIKTGALLSVHVLIGGNSFAGLKKSIGSYGNINRDEYAHRIAFASEDGNELLDLSNRVVMGYGSGYLTTDKNSDGRVGFRLFESLSNQNIAV